MPDFFAAANNIALSRSLGWTSTSTRSGITWSAADFLGMNLLAGAQVPAADEPLGVPLAGRGRKSVKIVRAVEIQRDTGQVKHNTWQACLFGGCEMRKKTVIPKAKREQISGRAEGGVGSTSGGIGSEHGTRERSRVLDLLQLGGINQRNICRNHQRAKGAAFHAYPGCALD